MDENNFIIDKYKNKLFDDYYTYLGVISELNKTIPSFAEGMGFYIIEEIKFDYPEFCKKFLKSLRNNIDDKKDIFDHMIIYHIFEELMYNKILDNIEKTVELYQEDEDSEEYNDDFEDLTQFGE